MKGWFIITAMAALLFSCETERRASRAQSEDYASSNVTEDFHPSSVSPRAESRYSEHFAGHQGYAGTNAEERFEGTDDVSADTLAKYFIWPYGTEDENVFDTEIDRQSVTSPEAETGAEMDTEYQ